MDSSPSSSSSSLPEKGIYQVFISFNGDNSRGGILSHLIRALEQKQINAFDDTKLQRAKSFDTELMRIIEESDLSIVIFTPDYPKSKYCMEELEKIHESMESRGHLAFPVFHKIDTSVVQSLKGNYAVAKQKWRDALQIISCKSGADEKNFKDEAELIAYVVDEVSKILGKLYPNISHDKGLFGINSRIKEVEKKLQFEPMNHKVRMIGIWGMGGVGKTTIADKVYHRNKNKFQGHYFVPNVRETLARDGPSFSLRDKIARGLLNDETLRIDSSPSVDDAIRIRIKRVKLLLVLDDVFDCFQLNSLLKKCGLDSGDSFCPGSRIVVTSRDSQVLEGNLFDSHDIYPAQELNDTEALHLLRWSAFGSQSSPPEYAYISEQVLKYACRLPLALVVLGSHLKGKNPCQWEDALKKFQTRGPVQIQELFQISLDGLDPDERNIFLDIACFLKGKKRDYVTNVLGAFGFHARTGLDRLVDKSLVKFEREDEGEIITMHDLLEQFGQNFVAEDKKSRKIQSRLWTVADIKEAFADPKGTENVEVISLEEWILDSIDIDPEAFKHMRNLRFLNFKFNYLHKKVNCTRGLEFLPPSIKYLHWDNFSQTRWPPNCISENLVELHLGCSKLTEITWTEPLVNLKFISLSGGTHLVKIPDWDMMPNVEVVDLGYCSSLFEIGSSLEKLNKLKKFNVNVCRKLLYLPELPNRIEEMELSCSGLRQLPSTFGRLYQLKQLSLSYCRDLKSLPATISGLMSLEVMDLMECSSLVEIGSSLENMKKLTRLDVSYCRSLSSLPELPSSIVKLNLFYSGLKGMPSTIGNLTRLKELSLALCDQLENLPSSICNLTSLETLDLSNCRNLQRLPDNVGNLVSLKELNATHTGLTDLPQCIENLNNLIKLDLMGSKNLQTVPALPSNVELFYTRHCISLRNEVKSSIVEQYRQKVHDRPTKIRKFCVDVRQLPKWMMYCNHSGTSISWKLQTFGHLVDIIFCVVISSNSILSRLNPVAILTLQNSETYQLLAYPDEAPEVMQHDWGTPCYLFMWNCNNVDCKFLKEVSFEVGADSSDQKIIKCGAHPIFHMKNKSTSAHKKDKKRSRLNYKLSTLSIEQ